MSSSLVVEVGGGVVGVAVRCAGGYRFFASEAGFRALDGEVFPRLRALYQAVRLEAATLERAQPAPPDHEHSRA